VYLDSPRPTEALLEGSGMKRTTGGRTGLATVRGAVLLLGALPFLPFLLFGGCGTHISSEVDPTWPTGEWLGHGECLPGTGENLVFRDSHTPYDLDCLKWEYDGEGLLEVTHVNAGFNCAPEIEATLSLDPRSVPGGPSGTIEIIEHEISDIADCNCLFELEYALSELPPRTYRVEVSEEPIYLEEGDAPLEFTLELHSAESDSFCVERDHYPWSDLTP
jgi:hypothetical protein